MFHTCPLIDPYSCSKKYSAEGNILIPVLNDKSTFIRRIELSFTKSEKELFNMINEPKSQKSCLHVTTSIKLEISIR